MTEALNTTLPHQRDVLAYTPGDFTKEADLFPSIKQYLPERRTTCHGSEWWDWSTINPEDLKTTIGDLSSELDGLKDTYTRMIDRLVSSRSFDTSPVTAEFRVHLRNLYKITLLIRIMQLYRDSLDAKFFCGYRKRQLTKYGSYFVAAGSFLTASIQTMLQKLQGEGNTGTLETVLLFSSGLCGVAAFRLQVLEAADKRRRKELDHFLFPLGSKPRFWHDQLSAANADLANLFEKFSGMKKEISREGVPPWILALFNIQQIFESSEVILTDDTINELRAIYLGRIEGKKEDLKRLRQTITYIDTERLLAFEQTLLRGSFVHSQPLREIGDRVVRWLPPSFVNTLARGSQLARPEEAVIAAGLYQQAVEHGDQLSGSSRLKTGSQRVAFPSVYSPEVNDIDGGA